MQAKEIVWPGGSVKTKLPWISDAEDPKKNILQIVSFFGVEFFYKFNKIQEENHVEGITKTGRPATETEWVSFVNYEEYENDFDLGEFIRQEMSRSWVVVLRGYTRTRLQALAQTMVCITPNQISGLWKKYAEQQVTLEEVREEFIKDKDDEDEDDN